MNNEVIKQIFQSSFDYKRYCTEIVNKIFGCTDIATSPEPLDTTAEGDECYYIGRMTDADGRELGFFYTRMASGSDVRRKRVGLRKLIAPYLKYDVDAAIAVFADNRHWRFSYICDMKEGSTAAKRFSYILGEPKGQYKTPLERLSRIASASAWRLSDIRDAFSVDALSKEFFDEYHRHYDIIVDELKRQGLDSAAIHDYVKKMMGRIVFLHFLQKKGWLNNNPVFLRDLFFFSPHQTDFLEQVLEPLFFGIFNTEKANRQKLFADNQWDIDLLEDWRELPYLNGGLFERDSIDDLNITLPASLFEDLFNFMASYNFTVDENDPDDAEVGVDPEMLGKIFESLLEDNKAKGAFYTPKEIVRYMCKESLIAYLGTQASRLHADETSALHAIRTFVETHEMQPDLEPYRDILDNALREVKICDPAIGSGAFPMGLLNELWRCREAVENTLSRAELKKEIIENNIYGVDIEKGAIDIARLRFWLSIVVDSESPEALPNFDYKFMQGNSLIESFDGHDLSHIMNDAPIQGKKSKKVADNQIGIEYCEGKTKQNLQVKLKAYFGITDHKEKDLYRKSISESVRNYIIQQGIGTEAENRLQDLDPSANQDFFLWHTWFKDIFDNGGFDIVIGNPPYLFLSGKGSPVQKLKNEGKYEEADILNKMLNFTAATYCSVSKGCRDYYKWFYKLALNVCKNKGILAYITPDTYFNMPKYQDLRNEILLHSVLILVDLGFSVFDAPTVSSSIIILVKDFNQCNKTVIADVKQILNRHNRSMLDEIIKNYSKDVVIENNNIRAYKNKLTEKIYTNTANTVLENYLIFTEGEHNIQIDNFFFEKIDGSLPVLIDSEMKRNTFIRKGYVISNLLFSELHFGDRLLLRKTGDTIVAAMPEDNGYAIAHQNVYVVKSISDSFSIKFWLGVLNSKLLTFLYQNGLYGQKGRTMAQFRIYALNAIPIPRNIDAFDQTIIIKMIDEILLFNNNKDKSRKVLLEREIDKQVYALYNLTTEEIAIIEGE